MATTGCLSPDVGGSLVVKFTRFTRFVAAVVLLSLLGGCATVASSIGRPDVSLRNVEVGNVDFSKQTFVLGFDVSNPNPFPLPINFVSYGIKLNEQRFASGETSASFKIPANGDGEFAISVDLDLLRTAPQLLYTLRDGVSGDLSYELTGSLGIEIPFVKPVSFQSNGEIRVGADDFLGRN
jgi:LEA14-like dessication related protein